MAAGLSGADGGVINVSLLWWTVTWCTAVAPHQWVTALWPAWARLKTCSPEHSGLCPAHRFISITTLCMDPGEGAKHASGSLCFALSWCLIVPVFGFRRLEMLQQIANRVQRDCVSGEDKIALARTALQSVSTLSVFYLNFQQLSDFIIQKFYLFDK